MANVRKEFEKLSYWKNLEKTETGFFSGKGSKSIGFIHSIIIISCLMFLLVAVSLNFYVILFVSSAKFGLQNHSRSCRQKFQYQNVGIYVEFGMPKYKLLIFAAAKVVANTLCKKMPLDATLFCLEMETKFANWD